MAFDGITIAAMVQELHKNLDNGRFNKISFIRIRCCENPFR